MKIRYNVYINTLLFTLSVAGCNFSNSEDEVNKEKKTKTIKQDSLVPITSRLYKNQITGDYYFKFRHIPIGAHAADHFVAVLDMHGEKIKNINEDRFKQMFGFYIDDIHIFRVIDHYGQYEVHALPIDSIIKGCYFEKSNYRVLDNRIEYYQGRDVSVCGISPNRIVKIPLPKAGNFEVLNIDEDDCAILNGKIYVNGCLSAKQKMKDSLLNNKILNAIRAKLFKPKFCF